MKALGFIASDPDRIERFLTLSGLTPGDLRGRAGDPGLLAAVLEYLRSDQPLLLIFAESEELDPSAVDAAGVLFGGYAG